MKQRPNSANAGRATAHRRNKVRSSCSTSGLLTLLTLLTFPALGQSSEVSTATPQKTFLNYFLPAPPPGGKKAERPSVYIENGRFAAMTLAVIDVEKEQDRGGGGHGCKVIRVPFDGQALDRDLS